MDHPSRVMRTFSSVPPDPLWNGDFDILDPRPEQIHLADIAHGLAGKFRFAGQSPIRKTVARHSLEVADRCMAPIAKVWAMFHDAAEAYMGDVPRPHKRSLWFFGDGISRGTSFAGVEQNLLAKIAERFHLPWWLHADIAAEVHAADDWALERDQRTLWARWRPATKDGNPRHDEGIWLHRAEVAVEQMAKIAKAENG